MNNAGTVLREIMAAPDKGFPEEVLVHAKYVAVVPRMIKAGLVFGGENGRSLSTTCRTAAGPIGRHASADIDWKLDTEVLTYSRAKGAFAGLTLTGANLRRDDDAFYGHDVSTRGVLKSEVAVPVSAQPFLDAVRGAKAQARAVN
jgi:SH3 domain-containing YSC84-like protein 1